MHFEPWQWALLVLGALLVGVAKTGIAGLGMLFVVIFAQLMPAKAATGMVLPLLCFGDLVAVASYRQHASWPHLWRLFPWAAAGVVLGYFAMNRIGNREAQLLIGGIVMTLITLHVIRRWRVGGQEAEHGAWFAPTIGVLAGFTTLVANAAGPLMAVYLLAMRLPKMEYVGTGAVFFMLLNLFKVPFMVDLGLITSTSFSFNLLLAPAVLLGALIGRRLLAKINQRWFENLALGLSAAAGLKLLF
ncbi:MAG: sulfite exporter TauE/SafE family protein [Opitutus sp.]|nr:sulfite exporter TauE/SafE family protein [Opitutus sp.]